MRTWRWAAATALPRQGLKALPAAQALTPMIVPNCLESLCFEKGFVGACMN